jgi:hypothetical protein
MEQVIRGFLPWQAITKKYFTNTDEVVKAIETEPDSESESEEEEEEEKPPIKTVSFESEEAPKLTILEEDVSLDVKEEPVADKVDSMQELESKLTETLVLNL